MSNYKINDKVTICEDEIASSNDHKLLTSLIGQKLTVIKVIPYCDDLVHYTLKDENRNTIMHKDDIPFGFIDADLKYFNKIYTIKGYYKSTCYDKCYMDIDASSRKEALELAKLHPEEYEVDYKNIDISDGEYIDLETWEVLDD